MVCAAGLTTMPTWPEAAGAVGADEEHRVAGAYLAGGDLPPVGPLLLAGARDGQTPPDY
jgi:hypothetical protein